MSLLDLMEDIIKCPHCGTPMIMQDNGHYGFPYLECPNAKCGVCLEVRI